MLHTIMERMCRICSDSESPTTDMFLTSFREHSIAYLISRYLFLKVEKEDKFSHRICDRCVNRIAEFHKFAQLAADVQKMFVLGAEKDSKIPSPLPDEEIMDIFVVPANAETAEKRAESLEENVKKIKSSSKTFNQSFKNLEKTQEKKLLTLRSSNKKQDASVRVAENFNVTNNSRNKRSYDGPSREDEVTQIDNVAAEAAENNSRVYTLEDIVELSETFLSSNSYQTSGEDSVMDMEWNESGVTRKSSDTPEQISKEQKRIKYERKCSVCYKRVSHKKEIENNLFTHTHIWLYKCPHCNFNNTEKHLLKQHINSFHSKTYECDICNKVFSRKYGLFRHKLNHSHTVRYACKVCKLGFSEHWKCDQHFRQQHMGETLFKCHICKRNFSRKNLLNSHISKHEEKKLYCCTICNKSFSRMYNKKNHMRKQHKSVPTVYKCDFCNRQILQKVNLHRHIYTHLRLLEKPIKCESYPESFGNNYSLRNLV